jgi:hypothetical protein
MPALRPLLFALAAGFSLVACATPTPGGGEPTATTPPSMEETPMTCQADKGQWALGQLADDSVVAKVRTDTTSDRMRVIKPGMAVTMDFREDRVNVEVDADNRVIAVRCG